MLQATVGSEHGGRSSRLNYGTSWLAYVCHVPMTRHSESAPSGSLGWMMTAMLLLTMVAAAAMAAGMMVRAMRQENWTTTKVVGN